MLVTPTVPLCGVFFGTPLAGTHIPTRQPLTVLSTVRGVALSSGLFLAQELVHQPVKQPGINFYASRVTPVVGEIRPVNRAVRYLIRAR